VFLSSLRDSGFVVHPFPAMNRWAIIISPYGTRLLLNTSGLSEKALIREGRIPLIVGIPGICPLVFVEKTCP
jgi:hypothetical protein